MKPLDQDKRYVWVRITPNLGHVGQWSIGPRLASYTPKEVIYRLNRYNDRAATIMVLGNDIHEMIYGRHFDITHYIYRPVADETSWAGYGLRVGRDLVNRWLPHPWFKSLYVQHIGRKSSSGLWESHLRLGAGQRVIHLVSAVKWWYGHRQACRYRNCPMTPPTWPR